MQRAPARTAQTARLSVQQSLARRLVHETSFIKARIGQSRTLTARTFDLPTTPCRHERHLVPLPPPLVYLAGKSHPDVCPRLERTDVLEELSINLKRST